MTKTSKIPNCSFKSVLSLCFISGQSPLGNTLEWWQILWLPYEKWGTCFDYQPCLMWRQKKKKKEASGKWIRSFSAICVLMFSAVNRPEKGKRKRQHSSEQKHVMMLLPKAQRFSLPSKLVAACWHPQVL